MGLITRRILFAASRLDAEGLLWYICDMGDTFKTIGIAILLLMFLVSGCTLLSPVGAVISSAYENTVSYFNAYYNASKLFHEAEEEILARSLAQQDFLQGERSARSTIPPSARQKLNLVVDKCSNILSFHPQSALVDDALMLIGKSYYYMGEYAKAERKFTELLAQFPESAFVLESQLWLVKSSLHLANADQSVEIARRLVASALEDEEEAIAGQAYVLLGDHYENAGNARAAIDHYTSALPLMSEPIDQAITTMKIGKLWLTLGDSRNALDALKRARGLTSDSRLLSQSGLLAIRVTRELGQYAESLEFCNLMLKDFRVLDYAREIKLEKASTLVEMKRTEEALELLATVDTSSVRSEFSTRAAFAAGQLHEKHLRDYHSAAASYARAAQFNLPSIAPQAQARLQAITRYFDYVRQHTVNDSLLALPDTIVVPLDSMLIVTTPLAGGTDSTQEAVKVDTLWNRVVVINHDSLKAAQTNISNQLGELFYSDLDDPDSALIWYSRALSASPDSLQLPRAIFVVAELRARDSTVAMDYSAKLYRSLLARFPNSSYAAIAKQRLGIPVENPSEDPASDIYANAERKLDEGLLRDAVREFRELIRQFPDSPLAAQSAYAIGWIFEHKLSQPDSAIANYKRVVDRYGESPFSALVRPRIGLAVAPVEETRQNVPEGVPLDDEPRGRPGIPASPQKEDVGPDSRRERAATQKKNIKD